MPKTIDETKKSLLQPTQHSSEDSAKAQCCTMMHNRAQWPAQRQHIALTQSNLIQSPNQCFAHCAHNAKNHCAVTKIPYPHNPPAR
jgi:hypothetical protein